MVDSGVKILVDADACPGAVKDILYRAAERRQIPLTLVANKFLRTPSSPYIRALQVPRGFDVADSEIVQRVEPGDVVITADIPLAALVIGKGGYVLDPRGDAFTTDNIGERLNLRDFMDTLRSSGVQTGGPAPLSHGDRMRFANALDGLLTRLQAASAFVSKEGTK